MKKVILGILFIGFTLNADVVMCTGYQSIKSIDNALQSKQDISNMNFRLNTTNKRATVVMDSEVNNYKYVREEQHPAGHYMDVYIDSAGFNEELKYTKSKYFKDEFSVAAIRSVYKENKKNIELVATFICKKKEYAVK